VSGSAAELSGAVAFHYVEFDVETPDDQFGDRGAYCNLRLRLRLFREWGGLPKIDPIEIALRLRLANARVENIASAKKEKDHACRH
jgi:hypothetical protein